MPLQVTDPSVATLKFPLAVIAPLRFNLSAFIEISSALWLISEITLFFETFVESPSAFACTLVDKASSAFVALVTSADILSAV